MNSYAPIPALFALTLSASIVCAQAGNPNFTTPSPTQSPTTTPAQSPTNQPTTQPTPDRAPTNAPTVDLRPKFRKGQQLRYTITMDARNSIKSILPGTPATPSPVKAPGQPAKPATPAQPNPQSAPQPGADDPLTDVNQDQTVKQQIGLLMTVTDSTDTGSTVQVTYESIKISMDSTAMGRAEFDSTATSQPVTQPNQRTPAQPASNPNQRAPGQVPVDPEMSDLLAQIIRPMVGTTLELKLDQNGVITSVTGGSNLSGAGALSGLLGGLAGGLGGAGGGMPGMPSMPGTGGTPALPASTPGGGNWLTGSASSGNAAARRIGESWTSTDNLGATPTGPFTLTTTHTLRGLNGAIANLSFTGRGQSTGSQSSQSPLSSGISLESISNTGTYQWDTTQGALREMNSEMRTSMTGQIGESKVRMTSEQFVKVNRR